MSLRRTYLVVLAVLVAAFVALYPYLGALDMCHSGECPYAVASAGLCLSAVLAILSVRVFAFAGLRGQRIFVNDSRPEQLYLSPDPYPPQLPQSR